MSRKQMKNFTAACLDDNDLDIAVAKTVKTVSGMKKVKEISKAKK